MTEFAKDVIERLESAGVTYALTGSFASNYWGRPRLTHDIDFVIVLAPSQVDGMTRIWPPDCYVSLEAVKEALRFERMFNVLYPGTGLKADMWVMVTDPFNHSFLNRRRREELFDGFHAWVGAPEDVLLSKLVWYKKTPSDRQLEDAAGIAAVQAGQLDLEYMRSWAERQSTTDLLEDVLAGKGLKST